MNGRVQEYLITKLVCDTYWGCANQEDEYGCPC